jgi:photosynthetic reaction center cytochrome c subunit/tetratricopeptide repeat protein
VRWCCSRGERGRGQAQPAKNLQVLPKDMPRPAIVQRMREFSLALGVRCEHCHMPQPAFDADDKVEKQKAREMIKMVNTINTTMLAALPGHTETSARVDCVTCHRGLPVPRTLQSVLTETLDKGGVDAAIKQYRDLREKEGLSGHYDFSETTLNEVARAQNEKGNVDAAIALLEVNSELNPKSQTIDFQLGEYYRSKGNTEKALARYKAAVEKNPNDARAKARVAELEKKQ